MSTPRVSAPRVFPLPTVGELLSSVDSLASLRKTDALKWALNALYHVDRVVYPNGISSCFEPSTTRLPTHLKLLLDTAVPAISMLVNDEDSSIAAVAIYLRASLLASGAAGDLMPKDRRRAFKDFELAARKGYHRAWYRLGKDYESVGEYKRAKECYDRGSLKGDCECNFVSCSALISRLTFQRLGMAHLLGQIGVPQDHAVAIPLLRCASRLVSLDAPHPAYVAALLLSHELKPPRPIPSNLILDATAEPEILQPQLDLALVLLQQSAYFHHPPAQLRMGQMFECATFGFPHDPLMSVQWYTLASRAGVTEADMALCKWYLCGAEGLFERNEGLARAFAERAAGGGHPQGTFAMGYCFE